MDLLPGVRSHTIDTDRLRMRYIESGPEDGIPVVLVHGNLATCRFYEHLFPGAPDRYRFLAPDMRGFGDTDRVPIDATRGLRDWADDTHALVRALGIERPVHLVGWSTGGGAIAVYAMDRPVASLTLIDPVGPYGFGGVRADGTPCAPDYAGSGGGTGSPDFTERLASGDHAARAANRRAISRRLCGSQNHHRKGESENEQSGECSWSHRDSPVLKIEKLVRTAQLLPNPRQHDKPRSGGATRAEAHRCAKFSSVSSNPEFDSSRRKKKQLCQFTSMFARNAVTIWKLCRR